MLRNGPHVLGNGLHMLGNGPHVLDNGPHVLDNGPHVLDNGPHVLGKSTLGILLHLELCHSGYTSHSGLCRIQYYVAFRIMLHSGLCCSGL